MKKRIMAVLLTITMLFSVFNAGATVLSAGSDYDVTITVLDYNGNIVTDSGLSVSATCAYRRTSYGSIRTEKVSVTKIEDSVFGYNYSSRNYIQYYTVNVTLRSDDRTYTASEQVAKNANSVVVTLEDYVQADRWETFDIYYIADGHFPESFYGYGEPEDYGPAGNDTPLLKINVNITKLRSAEFSNVVSYQENVQNTYHFIPAQISDNPDDTEAYKENVAYAKAFWDAVVKCMDDVSIKAFEATGLFKNYIVYCLKNQGTAAKPDNHGDGILVSNVSEDGEIVPIDPPVYVIEMYDHEGKIFGGYTNDEATIVSNPVSMKDIKDAYNKHFGQEIPWNDDDNNGIWEGSYITEENGRKYQYNLQIIEINAGQATEFTSKADIDYDKKTDTYYLAAFKSAEVSVEQVAYILTYKDGVEDFVFNDQVNSLNKGDEVVEFGGKTDRENYIFLGWTLEGGDGTVLSQDEILEKYKSVNSDLTFVAVYEVAPSKYTGTVEVILDGYYKTATATATGERVDITTVKGDNISLYVKAEDTDYIKLERTSTTSTGVYSAQLLNGDYKIYYYDGENYVLSSDQHLNINNEDRTRYIFFEYVEYDLNGGVGGPVPTREYYDTGVSVKVSATKPTKQGYLFAGWKVEDGTADQVGQIYQAGNTLSDAIGESYKLTAQWVDAADVYINVTIDHDGGSSGSDITPAKDDVSLGLVFTPNADTPYIETGHTIDIDNENHPNHNYTYETSDSDKESILKTFYIAETPSATNLPKDYLYSVTVNKPHYNVTAVTARKDSNNGDIIIDVELKFAPNNKDLNFEVLVDKDVPVGLLPQAAIVKVLAWSSASNSWEIIIQHRNTATERKPGVRVDIDPTERMGTGSYPVWVNEVLDDDSTIPYGYRIIVTALIYPDGTIVETDWASPESLKKFKTKLYTVDIADISNGIEHDGLRGAYFDENGVQTGELDAVISAKGYTVTFDANGGTVNGFDTQKLENQYKIPSFDGFVPVRDGGYVFDGWYIYPDCTLRATEGEYLYEDIILCAKWKEPLKIEGIITVGATYEQENEDGTVTIQDIPQHDWIKSLIVLLQKVEPNGYTDTVNQQFITLDYENTDFYFGERTVGYAPYSFTGIPDLGNEYRIQVLIHNYNAAFQNETNNASINDRLNYPSYEHDDYYQAVFGTEDPQTATVNVHAHFLPSEFELKYSVNAQQIGDGFKPLQAEVLVTADGAKTGVVPSQWGVISQMIINGELVGDNIEITDGIGHETDMVWIGRADGITNYQYGLRVDSVVLADKSVVSFTDALPFTVTYQAPAYYMNGAQVGDLVATFVPNTYDIIYKTNGGSLSGSYPTKHTWSFETSIAGIVPTFSGFKFGGWYLDKELTQPADDYIGANVAADTTLYAKWIQVMDVVDLVVTIKHDSPVDGGLASNFKKTLYTQLTYADRNLPANEQVYVDMDGYSKNYPDGQWHTHGDKIRTDTFEVPSFYTHLSAEYDYSADVELAGYYVIEKNVVKSPRPDGSTLHTVNITLQFSPDPFDVSFYVQMAADMPKEAYPKSVEVKVTSWYDDPAIDTAYDWYRITHHEVNTVTVEINPETGRGDGKCAVWHWHDEEKKIPYYYRIEVISLNFANGTTVAMNETVADVSYSGGGYNGEIVVTDGSVPETENENNSNTTLAGVYAMPSGDSHIQVGTVGAVIGVNTVVFHSNNTESLNKDIFRKYYPAASASDKDGHYTLNQDGTISAFYEIPEFAYDTHNKYVFKGWYLDPNGETPINWSDVYEGTTHIYACWIETGSVEKEDADNKKNVKDDTYAGFDLIGVQIRDSQVDTGVHYGDAGSGLRFITVLSDELYNAINALGNGNEAEYGFVLARSSTATNNANGDLNYTLQLKGTNINGVDTTSTHSYVQNFKCSGVEDHYDGENYRLYTVVITYKNYTDEELEDAYKERYSARSYIRYVDANGLERVYYNNYTGTSFYGGCSTSFAEIRDRMAR